MIRLYAVNILPMKNPECFEMCYVRSSQQRQEKADEFQVPADKARCIAAGLLLEYAYEKFRIEKTKELAKANSFGYVEKLQVFPEKMPEIIEGTGGKPQFEWPEGYEKECFFNLSHSGNYVICAMADFEVGADVQRRTRVREGVYRRFFSEEDRMRVESCGEDEVLRERMFARIWAAKEAQSKLTGRGIGQLVGQMLGSEEAEVLTNWQGVMEEDYAWAVVSCPQAAAGEPDVLELVMVDEGELFYEGKF